MFIFSRDFLGKSRFPNIMLSILDFRLSRLPEKEIKPAGCPDDAIFPLRNIFYLHWRKKNYDME
jgi:hypothetical protein